MKYIDKQGIALIGGLIIGGAGLAMGTIIGAIIAIVGVALRDERKLR